MLHILFLVAFAIREVHSCCWAFEQYLFIHLEVLCYTGLFEFTKVCMGKTLIDILAEVLIFLQ